MNHLSAWQESVVRFVQAHRLEIALEARALDLVSEVGELAKEILKSTRYGQKPFQPTAEWASELGDAFFSLICIANSTGVNLEDALEKVLHKYEQRLTHKGDAGSQ